MMRTNALQEKHLYGGVLRHLPVLQSREESGFWFFLSVRKKECSEVVIFSNVA